jgi:hypothetical protein
MNTILMTTNDASCNWLLHRTTGQCHAPAMVSLDGFVH